MSFIFRTIQSTKIWEFIKKHNYASTFSIFIVVSFILYRLRGRNLFLGNDRSTFKPVIGTKNEPPESRSSQNSSPPQPQENGNTQNLQGSDWKNIKDNVQQNSSQKKTTQKIEPVDVWGGSARETHIEGRDVPISSPRVMSKPAPNIVLDTYEPFSLSQYRGRWVILFFYPNNFDARDEIITLNTHLPKFTNLNTVLVGFAGVNEFHQQGFSIKNGINLPLLPDPDGKIAELYGVTFLNSTHTRTWFLIDPIGMVVNTANTISWENIFPVLQQHVRDTEKLFSEAREDISKLIHEKKCCLPLLRLVWEWWQPEDDKIHVARNFLFQLKEKYFEISGPDFFQISGNIAISELGGPKIPFRYGRSPIVQDSTGAIVQPRDSFGARFDEKDMVALAYVEALVHGQTEHPEKFSNEYYASILETEHSYIPKDGEDSTSSSTGLFPSGPQLLHNDSFREYVEKYAQSQEEFFKDFSVAFQKLQELGFNNLSSLAVVKN